jgi:flagellar protein FlgJ
MAIERMTADPTLSAGAVTDMKGLQELKAAAARNSPDALEAVAQQFEALFLGMMLDSMRAATIDGGLDNSSETELYQQLFDRQVASNLAEGRGLGIARLLVQQLSATLPPPVTEPATGPVTQPTAGPTAAPAAAAAEPGLQPAAASQDKPLEKPQETTPGKFIRQILPHARRAAAELGVHPMALVAQAALETGWGKRLPQATDGGSSLNLFGIKAGAGWNGRRAGATTLEFEGGLPVRRREQFRAYQNLDAAFSDYVRLIKSDPRYAGARTAGADPGRYAEALQDAGYATDPAYADKIRAILSSEPMAEARRLLGAAPGGDRI